MGERQPYLRICQDGIYVVVRHCKSCAFSILQIATCVVDFCNTRVEEDAMVSVELMIPADFATVTCEERSFHQRGETSSSFVSINSFRNRIRGRIKVSPIVVFHHVCNTSSHQHSSSLGPQSWSFKESCFYGKHKLCPWKGNSSRSAMSVPLPLRSKDITDGNAKTITVHLSHLSPARLWSSTTRITTKHMSMDSMLQPSKSKLPNTSKILPHKSPSSH